MKKIWLIIVMFSGLINLTASILMLLIVCEVVEFRSWPNFAKEFIKGDITNNKAVAEVVNIVIIGLSFFQVFSSIFAIKKPNNFLCFSIMIIISLQFGFVIYSSIRLCVFNVSHFNQISFMVIAEIGMIIGFIQAGRNKV